MNFDVEQWDTLVGDLYQSMLRPELLAGAVATANTALHSDLCHIVGFTPDGKETIRIFTDKDLNAAGDLYAGHYSRIDPRRKFIETAAVGATYRCSAFYDEKFVSANEFYQDFLIPQGFRYVIGACLYRSEAQTIFAAFNHGKGRPDFSATEQHFFGLYISHLSKVMGAMLKLAPVSQALESEMALDALQYGVIGLNAKGKITYANARSEQLLRAQLKGEIARGQLREGGALAGIVQQVLGDGKPKSLTVPTATGAPALFITIVRTAQASAPVLLGGGDSEGASTRALLVISSGNGQAAPPPSQLVDMFGLSPTEARLAHQITGGMSIKGYADTFCVSVATARTQLRAVLRKTGQSRQQGLVQMLASIPKSPA
ncbi:hypothetical protein [Massilia sp. DWR3-1-1]|uniref:helix-turn-helix transcriptional regulator n=1 Tax=Massilia sp. DWR3-1-1 TaxID=2804559 RepID=UPI003CED3A78